MKNRYLVVAGMAVAALCASVSQASAFDRSNCVIEPSIQHSTRSLIDVFTRSIVFQKQPEHLACTYYGRGVLYQLVGDDTSAIADFSHAIGWMADYPDAFAARGDSEEALGQHDKAVSDYAKAASLSDNLPVQLTARCWVRALRGRPLPLAVQDCDGALAKDPGNAGALTARGLAHLRMNNNAAAIADCDAAVKLESRDGSAWFIRGVAKLHSGDTTGGNADLAAANALTDRIADTFAIYGVKP
jgi:tetratricopeptide (TPR) repeat protein